MTTFPFYIPSAPLAASCPAEGPDLPIGLAGLLHASGWLGRPEAVAEAAGSAETALDFERSCAAARLLGVEAECRRTSLSRAVRDGRPCLFAVAGEPLRVLIPEADGVTCLHAMSGQALTLPPLAAVGHVAHFAMPTSQGVARWRGVLRPLGNTAFLLLGGVTLALNLLGMALPLFTIAVYDQVLAAQDVTLMIPLAAGAALAIGFDALLRLLRSVALGQLAARFDLTAGLEVLAGLLRLPTELLERTPSAAAAARLREVEIIRGFLFGPLVIACLEMPFALLYLLVLAVLAGWLVLAPLTVLAVGGLLAWQLARHARRSAQGRAKAAGSFQAVQSEMLDLLPIIKARGQEAFWLERFRQASAGLAEADLKEARLRALAQISAQTLTTLAAVATLGTGAALALGQGLTIGTLVAVMALVWRMLSPLSAVLGAVSRLGDAQAARRNLDGLMALPSEASAAVRPSAANARRGGGRITLAQAVVTYPGAPAPTLAAISVEFPPGQRVAVTGPNGGGKSTLLRLLCGLAQPQMGAVLLDGVDVRQIAPEALRLSLGVLPQDLPALPLSIAEFLRLGQPGAGQDRLEAACRWGGVLEAVLALPEGFGTSCMALSDALREPLWLARLHLSETRVLLLDEPACSTAESRRLLLDELERRYGESTVVLVTHQPELINACDRVLVLQQGALAFDGTPRQLAERLEASRR